VVRPDLHGHAITTLLLAGDGRGPRLDRHADFGPLASPGSAGFPGVEMVLWWALLATEPGLFSPSDVYRRLAPLSITDRLRSPHANPSALHLAPFRWPHGFRAGDHLFRVHLATLRGKSPPQAGHPRVLLEAPGGF